MLADYQFIYRVGLLVAISLFIIVRILLSIYDVLMEKTGLRVEMCSRRLMKVIWILYGVGIILLFVTVIPLTIELYHAYVVRR